MKSFHQRFFLILHCVQWLHDWGQHFCQLRLKHQNLGDPGSDPENSGALMTPDMLADPHQPIAPRRICLQIYLSSIFRRVQDWYTQLLSTHLTLADGLGMVNA